jgi:ectoine hydroxylase-related dioxygenase (phytanoyl-CoA dioxygenase family)
MIEDESAAIAQLWEDGAVYLPGVIDETWQRRLRDAIERDIADPGPYCHRYEIGDDQGTFYGNMRIWESDADFRAYCFESPLPALAARFLEARKVNLFYDQLFVKEPSTDYATRWHNDQPYWPVRGRQVMSFWVALDPVTHDSGALEFIKGSHLWELWFQPQSFAPGATGGYERNADYVPMPDIDSEREKYEFLSWEMAPGDLIAFHAMTVHGAGGNQRSDVRRRGYTVRYTGDDARYYAGPGTNQFLRNDTLDDGAVLDSKQYPVVWRAA